MSNRGYMPGKADHRQSGGQESVKQILADTVTVLARTICKLPEQDPNSQLAGEQQVSWAKSGNLRLRFLNRSFQRSVIVRKAISKASGWTSWSSRGKIHQLVP
jgi:hypothetical protein